MVQRLLRIFDHNAIPSAAGRKIFEALENAGYIDLTSSVSPTNDASIELLPLIRSLPANLQKICSLLLYGGNIVIDDSILETIEPFRELQTAGLVTIENDRIYLNGLCLYAIHGLLYFADFPNGRQPLYYGTDSEALVTRLPAYCGFGKRVLDYCSGPGIQGLVCAKMGCSSVTGVEINPVAAELARCNAVLNGLEAQYRVLNTSIRDSSSALSGDTFDLICANPPLLPVPAELCYPIVGDGGEDGVDITRDIIAAGVPLLSSTGHLLSLGMSACYGSKIAIEELITGAVERYKVNANLILLSEVVIKDGCEWTRSMADSINLYLVDDNKIQQSSVYEAYRKAGVSKVLSYSFSIAADNERDCHTHSIVDYRKARSNVLSWWV
ncbi:hypothetical protein KIMH_09680 [Bombiscardovia apis]|uniref:Methyltransferase small domain-containing protein n=1 Tax=Bombiscardovia apis TaxID=2932182 RepID=A0ABN6SI05_9BIFI|nr:methyltransferase [Bombiscardovia apis]BDR54857.1 hypothetical protein KIMH_09680 [Bombiscardovia apis]